MLVGVDVDGTFTDLALADSEADNVTISSNVAPQFRGFERFTTTAMNAFVGPAVMDFVARLEGRMRADSLQPDLHKM